MCRAFVNAPPFDGRVLSICGAGGILALGATEGQLDPFLRSAMVRAHEEIVPVAHIHLPRSKQMEKCYFEVVTLEDMGYIVSAGNNTKAPVFNLITLQWNIVETVVFPIKAGLFLSNGRETQCHGPCQLHWFLRWRQHRYWAGLISVTPKSLTKSPLIG